MRAAIVAIAVLWAAPATATSPDVAEALQLLHDWQIKDALALARNVLRERPEDPEAWVLAARVQHQRGEHLSAMALFDAAEDAGVPPEEIGYVHSLATNSARYASQFETHETEHFKIRYLDKDEIVAVYAAPVLEAAYRNIGQDLDFYPAAGEEKIIVEIYPDARGLAGATGLTVQEIETSGTIAVCKFHRLMITSPLATADGYGWADTLAHEYLHLVISKKSHNTIPIWLHEGIAKFYESRWNGAAGRALGPYGEKLLADATRKREWITYDEMHPSMAKLPSQRAAALAFAEVFTTIEFLVKKYGNESIRELLRQCGEGVSLDRALRRVFKMDLKGIEKAWRKYVTRRKFKIVPGAKAKPIKLAANEDEATGERALESMEDREVHDFSRLGELLQLRGHNEAAIVEYEKAYHKSGMRYITLINRLAKAYVATGSHEKAVTLLDEALAAHPESGDTHLLAGRIRFKKSDVPGARKHFEAARLQNPFNPEIHLALKELYGRDGKTERAKQEERFLELSRKPRPSRTYELPSPFAGGARVRVITPAWDEVRINGRKPMASPAWDVPVEAGDVVIEGRDQNGRSVTRTIPIKEGETRTVLL